MFFVSSVSVLNENHILILLYNLKITKEIQAPHDGFIPHKITKKEPKIHFYKKLLIFML